MVHRFAVAGRRTFGLRFDGVDMTLDDIEPDKTLVLTNDLARLFRIADCEPACHCCYEPIEIGSKFKLATHGDHDTMLCDKHTVADLIEREEKDRKQSEAYFEQRRRTGGYSRPTKAKQP